MKADKEEIKFFKEQWKSLNTPRANFIKRKIREKYASPSVQTHVFYEDGKPVEELLHPQGNSVSYSGNPKYFVFKLGTWELGNVYTKVYNSNPYELFTELQGKLQQLEEWFGPEVLKSSAKSF